MTQLREGDPCPECRNDRLKLGRLIDYHGLRFRAMDKGWWRTGRRVTALACERCGFMQVRLAAK